MTIELQHLKPNYMSEEELASSDIYLRDSLRLESGKRYLIKAASGHGKTSLLNFIYGSNLSFGGQVLYDGEASEPFELRQARLSYVFQDLKLFPELTAWENVQLKNALTRFKTDEEISDLFAVVGLSEKKEATVGTLSTGQRQRVAIVRALCQPFDFLLMDEPFSHLDLANTTRLAALIAEELTARQAGLLLASLENEPAFQFDTVLNL